MSNMANIKHVLAARATGKSEQGVAMITVLVMTTVLLVMATGMYFVASSEITMSNADLEGNEAFYYAEGGLEAAIDIISNEAATEYQLTQPRPDDSSDGYGYLMDPSSSQRQNPSNPLEVAIGKDTYTIWVDTVDANGNPCTGCGLNLASSNPAYLQINAEGQSGEGYRKLQQRVRVEASGYPLTFYIDGDINANGNPFVANQSIYVKGNVYGRSKVEVTGTDLIYGGPARVLATGTIYDKANGGNSQIYTVAGAPNGSNWNADYVNDRDSRGPAGNTFSLEELSQTINPEGLTATQLATLKSQAQSDGFYLNPSSGNLQVSQSDLPTRDGNVVVFVEYSGGTPAGNQVDLNFTWPSMSTGQSLVIVLNGSVKMTGQAIGKMHGIIYCPDGNVEAHGGGNGDYTGFVFGKGLTNIGNFEFNMTSDFLTNAPFFAWTVSRETAWTEVDR
ncbi:MAG: pilus assembly PilX family protein [Thermoleophilia bacterium]